MVAIPAKNYQLSFSTCLLFLLSGLSVFSPQECLGLSFSNDSVILHTVHGDLNAGFLSFPRNRRVLGFLEKRGGEKASFPYKQHNHIAEKVEERERKINASILACPTTSDTMMVCISFQSFFLQMTALFTWPSLEWLQDNQFKCCVIFRQIISDVFCFLKKSWAEDL